MVPNSDIGQIRIIGNSADAAYCANNRDRPKHTAHVINANNDQNHRVPGIVENTYRKGCAIFACVSVLLDGSQRRDVLNQYENDESGPAGHVR